MMILVSSGLLIVPLYRHYRKMKVHTAGRRDAQAEAHITIQSPWPVSLYFTWSTSWPAPSPSAPRRFPWISSLSSSPRHYPSLHSVILIMGNPRMKQTCERILRKTVCAWRAQGLWAGERGAVRRLFWDNFLIALPKKTDLKNFLSFLKNFLFYIGV